MELINSFVTVTTIGGSLVNGGMAKILDPAKPVGGETYYWDDTSGAREGFKVVAPTGYVVQKVQLYGSPAYPMTECAVEQYGVKLATKASVKWNDPLEWTGAITGTFDVVRYGRNDQAASRLHIYGTRGTGLIKANGKYYNPVASNYDTVTKTFKPTVLTDENVTVADVEAAAVLGNLFVPITVGDETFTPISKFNNFQIVSTMSEITMSALKRTTSMIVTRKAVYPSGVKAIDNITAVASAPQGSSIKVVISDDDGVTWKTTSDKGANWGIISATVPKKNYSEMNTTEKASWNSAVAAFGSQGIDYSILSTVNFNQFIRSKILFAVVINQPDYSSTPAMKTITWQYDATDVYRQMRDTEVDIDIVDETTVKVTPLIANDSIKVNISNG